MRKKLRATVFGLALIVIVGCHQVEPLPLDGTEPGGLLTMFALSGEGFSGKVMFQSTNALLLGNITGTGGISTDADNVCNTDAKRPNTSTYKALMVDNAPSRRACSTPNCGGGVSENLNWVLSPNTTYYREDRSTVLFTTNASAIFDFGGASFSNPIGSSTRAWTGLNTDWTISANDCASWSSPGGPTGATGDPSMINNTAIFSGNITCGTNLTIICVEQ